MRQERDVCELLERTLLQLLIMCGKIFTTVTPYPAPCLCLLYHFFVYMFDINESPLLV